jgi:hypothetical protein
MAFFIGGLCLSPIHLPAPKENIVIKDKNNSLIQIIPVFQEKYENKSDNKVKPRKVPVEKQKYLKSKRTIWLIKS